MVSDLIGPVGPLVSGVDQGVAAYVDGCRETMLRFTSLLQFRLNEGVRVLQLDLVSQHLINPKGYDYT